MLHPINPIPMLTLYYTTFISRDGSTGGCGGEHPPTGVQTQVDGGGNFYKNVLKKTKVLLKNEGKIVIQEKSFACGEQLS